MFGWIGCPVGIRFQPRGKPLGRCEMKKAVTWIAIVLGGLIVLVIPALLIIPSFVDVQKYKPQI